MSILEEFKTKWNDYKSEDSSDGRFIMHPLSLPYRCTLSLRNRFGTKEVDKEVVNVLGENGSLCYTHLGKSLGISDMKVIASVNNRVTICRIFLSGNKPCMSINDMYYEILKVDGQDVDFYMPHMKDAFTLVNREWI